MPAELARVPRLILCAIAAEVTSVHGFRVSPHASLPRSGSIESQPICAESPRWMFAVQAGIGARVSFVWRRHLPWPQGCPRSDCNTPGTGGAISWENCDRQPPPRCLQRGGKTFATEWSSTSGCASGKPACPMASDSVRAGLGHAAPERLATRCRPGLANRECRCGARLIPMQPGFRVKSGSGNLWRSMRL